MFVEAEERGFQELTDDDVQRMYQTVYFLHRDPEKVRCVIQEAVEGSETIQAQQDRRPETPYPVRARAESFLELLQLSLFEVSVQRWERDLEQWAHQQTPAAQPDASTLLTQYLAHLAWHGIRHYQSIYTAVSEGCLLYRYSPLQVCTVFALAPDNRGRVKRRLQGWLGGSFQPVALIRDGVFVTRPPTAWERKQIQQALTLFTPWGSDCISPDVFRSLSLPLGFDDATLSEHDRKHALMHPNCAGIERLVCEWNRQYPEERLDDPDTTLEVPMFPNSRPPTPENFDEESPQPLSDRELRELKGQMAYWRQRAQLRRRANAFHHIRVCVDGQERLHFAPGTRVLPFTVPLSAIRIQVFGQDAEGELPLAIFYLPDLEEEGDTQRLDAVLDGGATIELVLSPVHGQGGEVTAGRVAMQFWEDEAQVPQPSQWYDEAVRATVRRVEVARLTGDRQMEATLLARLGDLHLAQNQDDEALACWQASAALAQATGDPVLAAALRSRLGARASKLAVGQGSLPQPEVRGTGVRFWINDTSYPLQETEPGLFTVVGLPLPGFLKVYQAARRQPGLHQVRIERAQGTKVLVLAEFRDMRLSAREAPQSFKLAAKPKTHGPQRARPAVPQPAPILQYTAEDLVVEFLHMPGALCLRLRGPQQP